MPENTTVATAAKGDTTPKSGLSLVILGVLLSLIIKSALDHSFAAMSHYDSAMSVWTRLRDDPYRISVRLVQLLVFLFTLVRFYLGAYRYAENTPATGIPHTVATVIGTSLLFSGFYVASLTLHSPRLFLFVVVVFHFLDFFWFFFAAALLNVPRPLEVLVKMWQLFDFATIVVIGALLVAPVPPALTEWGSLGALTVVGAIDMWWFRKFYGNDPGWKQTPFIASRLGSA